MSSLAEPKNEVRYKRRFPKEVHELKTSKSNKEDIIKFLNSCRSKDLSYTRLIKYLNIIKNLTLWAGFDFKDATKEDIETLVNKIRDKGYMVETEKDYKVCLKYFYKIRYGEDEEYPKCVKWIKTTIGKHKKTQHEEVFSMEDMKRILAYLSNPRDRALIATAYGTGARPSEYLKLKLKNVNNFKEIGGRLTCKVMIPEGKTGFRPVLLTDIAPAYLFEWIQKHPVKEKDSYLFPPDSKSYAHTDHISDVYANKILKQACKELKIKKKNTPYWLRHSGITRDIGDGMTKASADAKFGWSPNSNTYATYLHLTGADYDKMELQRKGLLDEEEVDVKTQKRCWNCNKINGISEALCSECEKPLDLDALEDRGKRITMKAMQKNPEIQEMLKETIRDMFKSGELKP